MATNVPTDISYQTGFGNYFSTEAIAGALPEKQNSPQIPPFNLYAEQFSGAAFTMPRSENLRSWLYRKQPSVVQGQMEPQSESYWCSVIKNEGQTPPNALRWLALPQPSKDGNFLDGVFTMVANDHVGGSAVHHYIFNQTMDKSFFYNADGELIFIPVEGELLIKTEMGLLVVKPLEIAVIPRGLKFQVEGVKSGWCKGYLGENSGEPLRLPDLGPIGANGLANARDFEYPVAYFEESEGECNLFCKFQDRFWKTTMDHTPLDVVAWHGNYAPYKYDLTKFNTIGSISFDHPDPSIFTVLTSPSMVPGKANMDFVIFPPRWLVGEHTFRPPYYHRNLMNEYMGLITGEYDAKGEGFVPGGSSLHNCMVPHGPDTETFTKEMSRKDGPQKLDKTMAFMFESSSIYQVSRFAMEEAPRDKNYWKCWRGLKSHFNK